MTDEPDWRLTNQHEYLNGATLVRRVWRQTRPDWDHDHCEFCFAKLSAFGGDDLTEGWTTPEYRWICDTCFDDFRALFHWNVPEIP